jgi:hypothetical protein
MKIFGIGLNKTGTSSMHDALETLGFRSLHWGGPEKRIEVERALAAGLPLVDGLGDFDAYSDIVRLSENFPLLDRQYPDAKFILTTRDVNGWIASRRRHVERNRQRRTQGLYDGSWLEVDEPAWRAEFEAHEARVTQYFAGRRDKLLVFRIIDGDGYDQLCPFLGVAIPTEPFPWRFRGATAVE